MKSTTLAILMAATFSFAAPSVYAEDSKPAAQENESGEMKHECKEHKDGKKCDHEKMHECKEHKDGKMCEHHKEHHKDHKKSKEK